MEHEQAPDPLHRASAGRSRDHGRRYRRAQVDGGDGSAARRRRRAHARGAPRRRCPRRRGRDRGGRGPPPPGAPEAPRPRRGRPPRARARARGVADAAVRGAAGAGAVGRRTPGRAPRRLGREPAPVRQGRAADAGRRGRAPAPAGADRGRAPWCVLGDRGAQMVRTLPHRAPWPRARRPADRRMGSRRRRRRTSPVSRALAPAPARDVIVFRHTDPRFPFLWETSDQPAGRWNSEGEGPVHTFADRPEGAWAELLRHEEITDPRDVAEIRRSLWAVDVGDLPAAEPELPRATMTGGPRSYAVCRREAARLRERGRDGVTAPAAALVRGGAHGWRGEAGLKRGPERDGTVIVLFGARPDLVGWEAAYEGR